MNISEKHKHVDVFVAAKMAEWNRMIHIFPPCCACISIPRGHWEQSLPQVAQLYFAVFGLLNGVCRAENCKKTTQTQLKMAVNVHFNCFIDLTINSHTNPYNLASSRLLWSVQPWHTNGYAYSSRLCGTKNFPAICFSCSYQRYFRWSKFLCNSTEKT